MFDEQAFASWPLVIAGALGFAVLFALAALMVELLFGGAFRLTSGVVGFALAAFIGYVAIALLVRRDDEAGAG